MSESKELKPKSFRIDDETAEKFKEISVSIGASQQETLAKLIESYEFQKGKTVLTDRKSDIEQFEKYVSCLTRMYMSTLEDNQNITETVRTEFDALLKSKDAIIQDLQEKLTVAKQLKEESTRKAKVHADENENLKQAIESLNAEYNSKMDGLQSMLAEKDESNKLLKSAYTDLKEKNESMKEDAEQNKALRKELDSLKMEYNKITMAFNALEGDLRHEKTKYEQDLAEIKKHENEALERVKEQSRLEFEKKVLEIEKKYQEQIQKLKADKQKEIDKYQSKYFDLLQKLPNNEQNKGKVCSPKK